MRRMTRAQHIALHHHQGRTPTADDRFPRGRIACRVLPPHASLSPRPEDTGYAEGANLAIEHNQLDLLPGMAADLVRRQAAVIVASGGTVPAIVAKAATNTIPTVFAVPEDPVKLGLVAILARPGGNLTGVNFFFGELLPKRLELLHDLVPGMTRVAMFVNPANSARAEVHAQEAEAAGRAMGLHIQRRLSLVCDAAMSLMGQLHALPRRDSNGRFTSKGGLAMLRFDDSV
jgi:putative tryptophan/tyrosine transport system substrate-binding protein